MGKEQESCTELHCKYTELFTLKLLSLKEQACKHFLLPFKEVILT